MIVLIIASFLKFASSEYIEGSIILFVVIVNGLVSYWQERKAEESLNGLKQLMGQEAIVLSNGMQEKIPAKELVKGDVIVLRAGDVVPADVRLIEVHDLLVEESILTGESEASEKIIPFWQQKNQSVTKKIWLFRNACTIWFCSRCRCRNRKHDRNR